MKLQNNTKQSNYSVQQITSKIYFSFWNVSGVKGLIKSIDVHSIQETFQQRYPFKFQVTCKGKINVCVP